MNYDHPNYLIHREQHIVQGTTAGAATGGLAGSTFRSFAKAVVFGVAGVVAAAGSGGGCKVVVARRVGVTGTVSLCALTMVDTTLAANAQTYISFATPLTVDSYGDMICLHGSASAANDITDFGSVIWRYRLLPVAGDELTNTQAG